MTRRLLPLALALVAVLLAAPAGAHAATYAQTVAATPGLSDHWRLGEAAGATTAADATGAWPGTYAATTLGADGALSADADTAARFAGSGSVSAGNGPAFAGPMTVEAWATADAYRIAYLVSDGTSSSTGYHLWLASNGAPVFTVRMTGGTVQVQGAPLSLNAWHHLAATVDPTAVTLYADGVAVATSPALGTPRAATSTLYLGRYSGGSRNLRGGLDEVALYGAALDPATVAAHYALGADTRPPVTRIQTTMPGLTNATSATLAFATGKPGVTYECKLDAAGWSGCSSPATYANLPDGTHTFSVRARDRYGIVEVTPPARTWTVDTVPADTRAIGILPSAVQPTATVTFSSGDPAASFQCRSDGGAWAPCVSPIHVPGPRQLAVRSVDAAGNADPTPSTVAIPVAPTGASTATLTGPTAAFGFWTDGTGHPECNLDGGAWAPCGATLETGPLPPGAHALAVRAAVPGGAVQTVTTTWTVSLPAPQLVGVQFAVLVYVPPARKIGKSFPASRLPAVRFSLNVPATVTLSLDRTNGARARRHIATWTVAAKAGANVDRVPLAVYRKLGDARYRLTADAAGAAGRSLTRTVRFQVVRKKR
ncbi:MAG TPA: LamG domain-containing protein [Gemmatimonadaceae bacterium]|nr:LamG domain-containing protein [Gemmatimonadaceae bacterium]